MRTFLIILSLSLISFSTFALDYESTVHMPKESSSAKATGHSIQVITHAVGSRNVASGASSSNTELFFDKYEQKDDVRARIRLKSK